MDDIEKIKFKDNFWEDIKKEGKHIHFVIIATKPDIIKQAPIYLELKKQNQPVYLIHTGQHYDFALSGGLEEEFGLDISINLNISGSSYERFAQTIYRLGYIFEEIKKIKKIVIPWVHGDTFAANTVSSAAYLNRFASVHVEAGIRTLTPKKEKYRKFIRMFKDDKVNAVKYWKDTHKNQENFEKGSNEPWPEQWNTRNVGAAAGIHLASNEIVAKFIKEEGFPSDRIFITGNSVVDAVKMGLEQAKKSTIFKKYPILENGFIRFCIHRQENCLDRKRFESVWDAIKRTLAAGEVVLMISLNATEEAFDRFNLRDDLNKIIKKYQDTFIFSRVWPFYGDVMAAMTKSKLCVTDSGSMQEEMNEMQIPCVTIRFGSDRGESFFAGGNIIAPPIDGEIIFKIVEDQLLSCSDKIEKIYGNNVSEKSVSVVLDVLKKHGDIFMSEENRLFGD